MSDAVLYEADGEGIVTLTLNRPEMRNPISDPEMVEALIAALARLESDPAARVAILTGAGKGFSSGGNIHEMKPGGNLNTGSPAATRLAYKRGIQRLPLAFAALEVPVIAAVNGAAMGAGCDLTCMCDLRIAGESARFAESFVKLGLIAGDGGSWLLPRVIGWSKAAEMALTGDMIDAAEALACGLVSQVVPDAGLMDAARALARRIAANPPHAVRMTKRLLWEGRRSDLATLLEMASAMQAAAHATGDHAEAVDAFLEKRAPAFRGT
ncbi:crotonase/enoyl-CoA hydratase family protein [Novosphingobium album (ex Liu et al. 2023)]|uniref:Crotonase/enoyl-CoA hydratase family protein n=1 Tax=Novosphingobium album (ex Liu et al. 2023) TaxID=3031130 RepID=A0ABT5WUN8_9SPHN|nr:crotonase/enoyl-CoA hydratase family protein [Novosphingobium album (ex Liu et al. 2023)]MDE8653619.1 crotonase/enoyl-CoA hydratase family protein [Novosphingobium album (ex Liu et al. 2023)]